VPGDNTTERKKEKADALRSNQDTGGLDKEEAEEAQIIWVLGQYTDRLLHVEG